MSLHVDKALDGKNAADRHSSTGSHCGEVPLYELNTPAKFAAFLSGSHNEAPVDFLCIPGAEDCDGAIRVLAGSMCPVINDGDIVVFKRINEPFDNIFRGGLFLVAIKGTGQEHPVLCYVNKSEREGYLKLVNNGGFGICGDISPDNVIAIAAVKVVIRYGR